MTSKIKWLLVDIGDVLIVRNENNHKTFAELLVDELGVDLELAQEINKVHYTTMEDKNISEDRFVADLKEKLDYDAPKDIFSYFERAYDKQTRSLSILRFKSARELVGLVVLTQLSIRGMFIWRSPIKRYLSLR